MSTTDADAERIRSFQRENWTVAAPNWTKRRQELRATTHVVTDRLLAAARIAPGQRVLDLACGVGDPAFAIAERVGPSGSVLGLDLTPAMAESAQAHATEHGIANAEFRTIPSELDLGVAPASFDAATCRFGLMFMADPAAALRALLQALKPGGRVAAATWGPPERVPFMRFANQIVSRHLTLPEPDPNLRGPFTLPTPEILIGILTEAGFVEPHIEAFHTDVVTAPSAGSYWDTVTGAEGPLHDSLAKLPDAKQREIRDDAVRTLEAQFGTGPVTMGGEALVASAAKPV